MGAIVHGTLGRLMCIRAIVHGTLGRLMYMGLMHLVYWEG